MASLADDDDDLGDLGDLPCDTMVAIQLSLSRLPPSVPRIALRNHIYTLVNDRTLVDRQLDALRRKGSVHVVPLPRGTDEIAIVLAADFLASTRKVARACPRPEHGPIILHFAQHIVPFCDDISFTKKQLMKLMVVDPSAGRVGSDGGAGDGADGEGRKRKASAMAAAGSGGGSSGSSSGRAGASPAGCEPSQLVAGATEVQVETALVQAGLLVRGRLLDTFDLTLPSVGPFVNSMLKGRREVTGIVRRTKFKEILESDMKRRKLKQSQLGMQFHLTDLLAQKVLVSVQTTHGALLQLSVDQR